MRNHICQQRPTQIIIFTADDSDSDMTYNKFADNRQTYEGKKKTEICTSVSTVDAKRREMLSLTGLEEDLGISRRGMRQKWNVTREKAEEREIKKQRDGERKKACV